jgi:hypothetical protein
MEMPKRLMNMALTLGKEMVAAVDAVFRNILQNSS